MSKTILEPPEGSSTPPGRPFDYTEHLPHRRIAAGFFPAFPLLRPDKLWHTLEPRRQLRRHRLLLP